MCKSHTKATDSKDYCISPTYKIEIKLCFGIYFSLPDFSYISEFMYFCDGDRARKGKGRRWFEVWGDICPSGCGDQRRHPCHIDWLNICLHSHYLGW